MTSNSSINYRVIWALALVLLTMRVGFGTFFTSASDITPVNVAAAINSERSQRNIPTLNYNSKLAAAAEYKANDMVARKYFAHVDPDGHYIWDKIAAEGYTPFTILGENLAVDFSDTEGLISAWMDSPTHRENILNGNFKDQGVGVDFGNTANGEFSVAIANTFGAQAARTAPAPQALPAPQPVPKPAPAPKPAPQPAPQPTPVPAPSPLPQPKPIPVNTPGIAINNTVDLVYSNILAINGQTIPDAQISIQDLSDPRSAAASLQADASGQFSYTFNALANGQHSFQAQTSSVGKSLLSNIYKVTIDYNPPAIDRNNTFISAKIVNSKLDLHIESRISGEVATATASINGQSSNLAEGPAGTFSGDVLLDQYFNYQSQELAINAENQHHNSATERISMADVGLQSPNPKSLAGGLPQKAAAPDLYNVFKYVVIIFGGLFVLFLLIDLFKYEKKKITGAAARGSGSLLILLLIGTMLLVNWWH